MKHLGRRAACEPVECRQASIELLHFLDRGGGWRVEDRMFLGWICLNATMGYHVS